MAESPQQMTMNWLNSLADVQQNAWNTWATVARKAMEGTSGTALPGNLWRDGMNQWMNLLSPGQAAQSPEQAIFRNMFGAGEGFMRMGETMMKAFQTMQQAGQLSGDWTKGLNQFIDQAKSMWSGDGSMFGGMTGIPKIYQEMLSNWTKMVPGMMPGLSGMGMPSMPAFPGGEFLQAMSTLTQPFMQDVPAMAGVNRFLSIVSPPSVNQMNTRMKEISRLTMEYQQAMQALMVVQGKEMVLALETLQKRLNQAAEKGEPLDTMQKVIDLWVSCADSAHAKTIAGEEYTEANAKLSNSMNRLKAQNLAMIDEYLGSMNLPNRSELDAAHKVAHGLRRRMTSLEREVRSLGRVSDQLRSLRDDMEQLGVTELKKGLAALKSQPKEGGVDYDSQIKALQEEVEFLKAQLVDPAELGEGGKSAGLVRKTIKVKGKE
ncbi:MAG: class III poly(R)-hydroxyalkanoic acid synthase subunit PhaE [Magnetococcales bacterium]|nr:class III poly(R)-hydroxyalkanoic acid synthase subunit PhaE [Magnetococcales bacterium]MBF0156790.1 class III poly(R)-hydroxyalkanoic acid synthase subunit PhaE [Magnetococcales bacterium]